MREIKFRAWDGSRLRSWSNIVSTIGFHHWIIEKCEGVEIMQFTGLKDKNGGDIYEGDIVQYKKDYSCRVWDHKESDSTTTISKGTVFFRKGTFLIDYGIPCESLPEKHDTGENHACSWKERYYDFEVIGNIHENPELLK